MLLVLGDLDIPDAYSNDVRKELAFELISIYEHNDRRIFKERIFDDLLCGNNHGVGFARALCVPHQSPMFLWVLGSFYNFAYGIHLMRPQYHLF